jgi:hypothetical protein
VRLDDARTGWLDQSTSYKTIIDFDPTFTSETNPMMNINIPYPADFAVSFADEIVDTSDAGLGTYKAHPAKFSVWNVTEEKPATFFFNDIVKDSTLTPDTTEAIILFIDNPDVPAFKLNTTWRMKFYSDTLEAQIPPQPGDIYYIATRKPFTPADTLRFAVKGVRYVPERAKAELESIYVVPNPYVAAATWERRNPFRKGRGERRIWFVNLPQKCTIKIYTVRGYLVDTIEYNGERYHSPEYDPGVEASGTPLGAAPWDLVSKDNMDIAYGIYIYHVDAPGVGETVGKFAVIK